MIDKKRLKNLRTSENYIIQKIQKACSEYNDNRESLIYFFSHEILYYFLTYLTSESFDKNKISKISTEFEYKKIAFSKRNGKNIFIKKIDKFRRCFNLIFSLIGLLLNFKFVLIGNTPFSRFRYFKLLFNKFLLPDYFISQSVFKVKLPHINKQKKDLYKLVQDLILKFNIPKNDSPKIFNDIEYITNLYFHEKQISSKNFNFLKMFQNAFLLKCQSAIIGSPANIVNRHLAFICYQFSIKVKVILHHGEAGITDQGSTAIDDWGAADDVIGYGSAGLNPSTWSKYIHLWSKAKYHNVQAHTDKFKINPVTSKFSNVYDLITKSKGLYIESRIHKNFSLISISTSYEPVEEMKWRKNLLHIYPKLDIKIHPKGINTLPKKFLNRCIEGPLEKVSKNYDYLIFDNCGSSAFPCVYFNNVPIILIDRSEGEIYSKKGLDFVQKRCELFFNRDLFLNPTKHKEILSKSIIKGTISKNNFIINNPLMKQWKYICYHYSRK